MNPNRGPETHLRDYWRVAVKRRFVIYASLLVVTTLVSLSTFLTRPVYTARTRLQIEPRAPKILPFDDVQSAGPDYFGDFYPTQHGLIQSRRVARDVIAGLRLDENPEFGARPSEAAAGPAAGAPPSQRPIDPRIVDQFLARLTVAPVRGSRLVDVSFSCHDRELAAAIVNRVADAYIAFNTKAEYNTSERATASLAHEIANLQDDIDAREKELQAYARRNGILELGEKQNVLLKNLADMSDSLAAAQAGRIDREARLQALRRAKPADVPEVMQNADVQGLSAKSTELLRRQAELAETYKPDWPEMQRLRSQIAETDARLARALAAAYDQVVGAAESAFDAARRKEVALGAAFADLKQRSQEAGLKAIQYNNLKTQIDTQRGTLDALVRRQSETSSSAGLDGAAASNIRVVDPAEVPAHPSAPRTAWNIVAGLVLGLGVGLLLAFFVEYLDDSVRSAEEVQEVTGLPTIGLVPDVLGAGGRLRLITDAAGAETPAAAIPLELLSRDDPKSKAAEAFRDIRTAVLVSRPGGPPRSLLVASTQPGEGKTAVSLNLAITLSQMGRRVLLVDGDMRRPRIHRLLGLSNDKGLSSFLGGVGVPWPEPMPSGLPGLDVIPSGPIPPNPADLLDSDRFARLQAELETHGYDHILYDSPPILAVADPIILMGRVDAALIVVQAGVTGRDALRHAVRKLDHVRARVVGCVLNRVDASQSGYYGYGRYYGEEPREGTGGRARRSRRPAERGARL